MNNKMVEITERTPIEVLLQIDEDGMTTASALYEFLELDKSNYSKWCKRYIIDNKFATENEDYIFFVPKYENSSRGRHKQDFRLTAHFAKNLAMTAHSDKGQQAREYFIACESGLKAAINKMNKQHASANILLEKMIEHMDKMNDNLTKMQSEINEIKENQKQLPTCSQYSRYKRRVFEKMSKLADYYETTLPNIMHELFTETENRYDVGFQDYSYECAIKTGLSNPRTFDIIDSNINLREIFETVVDDILEQCGIEFVSTYIPTIFDTNRKVGNIFETIDVSTSNK